MKHELCYKCVDEADCDKNPAMLCRDYPTKQGHLFKPRPEFKKEFQEQEILDAAEDQL